MEEAREGGVRVISSMHLRSVLRTCITEGGLKPDPFRSSFSFGRQPFMAADGRREKVEQELCDSSTLD